ncbi:MAG: hypothetical protein ABSA47_17095 [Verrucomicrobiota bacterium]|jgi:hypothetical protein
MTKQSFLRQVVSVPQWTRHSFYLLGGCLVVMGLIACFWWPLARHALVVEDGWSGDGRWHLDWLLAGNFLAMFLLIMAKADLRADWNVALAGLAGGLAIECWGTQTNLWTYYTAERPPFWIIPAWPVSTLAIDRLTRLLNWAAANRMGLVGSDRCFRVAYWIVFAGFYALMARFVAPTWDKSLSWAAMIVCALIILTPTNPRWATLTFVAGSGLGYFLERWGTTRECWTYYTGQTPPLFAVLAHGMACVAFWRVRALARGLRLGRR